MVSQDAFWTHYTPHQAALQRLAQLDPIIFAMPTEIKNMERKLLEKKAVLASKEAERDSLAHHAAELQARLKAVSPQLKYNRSMPQDVNVMLNAQDHTANLEFTVRNAANSIETTAVGDNFFAYV